MTLAGNFRMIGVKYCGGCNPHIDRSALVQEIERLLSPGWKMVADQPTNQWEKAILVCGCPVACADRPAIRNLARQWVLVSGPMIDLEYVPEDKMAAVIVQKIQQEMPGS